MAKATWSQLATDTPLKDKRKKIILLSPLLMVCQNCQRPVELFTLFDLTAHMERQDLCEVCQPLSLFAPQPGQEGGDLTVVSMDD
jgi:hypothetical protein